MGNYCFILGVIDWNAVVQGLTTGIAASFVLAVAGLSWNRVRDFYFRRRLRREFRWLSCSGYTHDGITTGIRNHVGRQFIVRRLVMTTAIGDFLFNPTEQVSLSYKEQYPKVTRRQKRLLKSGKLKEIPMGTEFQFRSFQSSPAREGFAVVEPFTSREFVLPHQLIAARSEAHPTGMQITLEYEAWPGKRRIWRMTATKSLEQARKTLARVQQELLNGNLNTLRAHFGKPPISVKPSPPTGGVA